MPTYVYRTESGRTFETFQKMSESPLAQCPETGESCERVPQLPSIGGKEWGPEGASYQYMFDPRGIADLKKEMPSAELNEHGQLVFKNDSHQKRVYGEMTSTLHRLKEQQEATREKEAALGPIKKPARERKRVAQEAT